MNRNNLIAVSQRIDFLPKRGETRDAIDQRLIQWLLSLGSSPVPVPNLLGDGLNDWLMLLHPDAVVLSGGNDIGEYPERDQTEIGVIAYARRLRLPILGICRGAQILAHHAGTSLVAVNGHAGTRHSLSGEKVDAGELPPKVNSFHNWAIPSCPIGYRVLSTAPDGTVEAFQHKDQHWEGWMWHPERETPFQTVDLNRACRLLHSKETQ